MAPPLCSRDNNDCIIPMPSLVQLNKSISSDTRHKGIKVNFQDRISELCDSQVRRTFTLMQINLKVGSYFYLMKMSNLFIFEMLKALNF